MSVGTPVHRGGLAGVPSERASGRHGRRPFSCRVRAARSDHVAVAARAARLAAPVAFGTRPSTDPGARPPWPRRTPSTG